MFENSKDVLYIVLSFCVIWVTVFICWLLYHFISIFRQVNGTVKEVKQKIQTVESFFFSAKNKIENSVVGMKIFSEAISSLIKYFAAKKANVEKEPCDCDVCQEEMDAEEVVVKKTTATEQKKKSGAKRGFFSKKKK